MQHEGYYCTPGVLGAVTKTLQKTLRPQVGRGKACDSEANLRLMLAEKVSCQAKQAAIKLRELKYMKHKMVKTAILQPHALSPPDFKGLLCCPAFLPLIILDNLGKWLHS